ncbi:MAG: hypothetical protein JOZ83_04950, partial [Silvibacterium sp.]|nr:hypothetical protein [Silvibacterium sp.]
MKDCRIGTLWLNAIACLALSASALGQVPEQIGAYVPAPTNPRMQQQFPQQQAAPAPGPALPQAASSA